MPDSRLMVPIFVVSSVTGIGLPVLHAFLNALPALAHAANPLLDPTLERGSGPVRHDCASEAASAAKADVGLHGNHKADVTRSANGLQRADVGVMLNGHQRVDPMVAVNGQPKAAPTAASNAQQKADVTVGLMLGVNGQHQLDDTINDHLSTDADSPHAGYTQTALTHFQVDHTFEVKGVGCVVSGTVVTGEVAVGQKLNLGPTGEGGFREVQVTCIHRSQVHILFEHSVSVLARWFALLQRNRHRTLPLGVTGCTAPQVVLFHLLKQEPPLMRHIMVMQPMSHDHWRLHRG